MNSIPCREIGCTKCCEWQGSLPLAVHPNLIDGETGHCTYLDIDRGCLVHGTGRQPLACRTFNCISLLQQMEDSEETAVITRILISAVIMRHYINDKNDKKENEP